MPARSLAALARRPRRGDLERGSALVETAIVIPVLLMLAFGVVGIGRLIQADLGVIAVAREAARSAALANNASDASNRGLARGQDVASGYQLSNGSLQLAVDPRLFPAWRSGDSGGHLSGELWRPAAAAMGSG